MRGGAGQTQLNFALRLVKISVLPCRMNNRQTAQKATWDPHWRGSYRYSCAPASRPDVERAMRSGCIAGMFFWEKSLHDPSPRSQHARLAYGTNLVNQQSSYLHATQTLRVVVQVAKLLAVHMEFEAPHLRCSAYLRSLRCYALFQGGRGPCARQNIT